MEQTLTPPTVTILVAMYNAELTLRRCLDSLIHQTMPRIQVVCIDDASTDSSAAIAQEYAGRDSRFEVVRLTANGGPARARNAGLQRARGTYTAFLDSDDALAPDALEKVCAAFSAHDDTDCVLFDVIEVYPDGTERQYPSPEARMSGHDAFVRSLSWEIHGVYAVRTGIHRQHPYDTTCHSYSDDNTTRLHYLASRWVDICGGRYYYYQNSSSVTHAVGIGRMDYLSASASMKATLERMGVSEDIRTLYENQRWMIVIDCCFFIYTHRHTLSREDRQEAMRRIHQAWQSIETGRLTAAHRLRFGFIPFRPFWKVFCMEEYLYFSLRGLYRRIVPMRQPASRATEAVEHGK